MVTIYGKIGNDILNKSRVIISVGICGEEHFVFHEWKYSIPL